MLSSVSRIGIGVALRARELRERFHLSDGALALIAVAIAAVGMASTVLAKVAEDVIARNGLEVHDAANLQALDAHRSAWTIDLADVVTRVGSIGLLLVAAVAIGILLWRRHARLAVAATPLLALVSTGTVVAVTKQVVGRTRPPLGLRLIADGEPSFPSGHSADSAAVFIAAGILVAAIVLRRPALRALAVVGGVVLSGGIGLSRLVLGAHWPTDVLAGWALGTIVAVTLPTIVLVLLRATPSSDVPERQGRAVIGRVLPVLRRQRPTHWTVAAD